MKNKKITIIIAVICIIVLGLGIVLVIKRNKIENAITRYEWIDMLTNKFGITEYSNKEAYYKDVTADNEYFGVVQSAFEWEILDEKQEFLGEEPATGEFIALTSMRAIGKYKIQIYLEKLEEPTDKECLELAIKEELLKRNQMKKAITKDESVIILSKAMELYQYLLWKDDVSEINYQQGVLQIEHNNISKINEECTQVEIKNNSEELDIGKIIIIEHPKTKEKIAKKIKEVSDKDVFILEDVEFQEVIDSVVISDITSISVEDVISYYKELSFNGAIEKKEADINNYQITPVEYRSWESEDIAIKIETENGETEVSIIENGWAYSIPFEDEEEKEEDKGTLSASITIKDLCVGTQMIASARNGLEYFNLQTHADISVEGEMSLKEDELRISILKKPIFLGNGCIKVKVEFYVIISMDGSVRVEASIPTDFVIDYSKELGRRSPIFNKEMKELELIADCTTEVFFRGEFVPRFLGIQIIDVEADFGLKGSGKVTRRNSKDVMLCADLSVTAPLVTISVSGDDEENTLVKELNISGEWELVNEDNAWHKSFYHAEVYRDGTWKKVGECTYNAGEIDTSEPHEYVAYFNSSFVDKGDYFEVTGKLTDRVYIHLGVVKNMSKNDEYYYDGIRFIYKDKGVTEDNFIYYDFVDEKGNAYIVDTHSWNYDEEDRYCDMRTVLNSSENLRKVTWTFVEIDNNFKFKIRKEERTAIQMEEVKNGDGSSYGRFENFTMEQIYNERIKDYEGNICTETPNIPFWITFDDEGYMIPKVYNVGYGEITFVESN